ncbi:hypothetical protein DL771_009034 [Monosporascus sp. 5C6A]|nr:hypothetical protein DL771_009034 [Monosporascus sp. 5C6A]
MTETLYSKGKATQCRSDIASDGGPVPWNRAYPIDAHRTDVETAVLFHLTSLASFANALSIERGSLRIDGVIEPIAVDFTQPRLSSRLGSSKRGDAQTAYQIQAASSDGLWSRRDFRDSGRIKSDGSFVVYSGKSLGSRSAVYWRVRVQVNLGKNVIGVALGGGIYNADKPLEGRYTKLTVPEQELKLVSQLEYTCLVGGTHRVVSTPGLQPYKGPHLEDHWYGGEEYDARKEIKNWSKTSGNRKGGTKTSITTWPGGVLVSPKSPQLKVIDTVKAIDVKQAGSQWAFNFRVNFAGTFTLKIKGKGLRRRMAGSNRTAWSLGPLLWGTIFKLMAKICSEQWPTPSGSPTGGGYRNDPNGRAMIAFPLKHYKYYSDVNVLTMRHQHMVEYVDYLKNRANGQPYLNDGDLGDWLTLDKTTPKGVASTFGYYSAVNDMAEIEEIFGERRGSRQLPRPSGRDRGRLQQHVVQQHRLAALRHQLLGLQRHRAQHGRRRRRAQGRRAGEHHHVPRGARLALDRWERSPFPVLYGATSLWEHWDAPETGGSWNHFIYRTPRGVSLASWELKGTTLSYDVVVRAVSRSTVYLNSTSVTEGGRRLRAGRDGILTVEQGDHGQTVIAVGSGSYRFEAEYR